MRKVLTIAVREYKAAVLTKAFLIGLAMMPILMGGSIVIQWLFKDVRSVEEKKFAVIDRTPGGELFSELKKHAEERNTLVAKLPDSAKLVLPPFTLHAEQPREDVLQQRFELAELVRAGKLFGFLDIGSEVHKTPQVDMQKVLDFRKKLAGGATASRSDQLKVGEQPDIFADRSVVRYYSNSPTYNEAPLWARTMLNHIIRIKRGEKIGLDEQKLVATVTDVPISQRDLPRINRLTGEIEEGKEVNFLVSFLVPFGIVMLMFMVIMVGATPLMQGVVEEKMQRIAEVLLASASPFELMLGKLLGGVGVSLTLGSVYLAGGMLAAWQYGFTDYLSPTVLAWFLVYLVLAVLMFGSLFIAVGAACTEIKETQNLLMPVMLLAVVPLFFLTKIIQEPDGALARGISYFPFATPSVMVARVAIPPGAPLWEPFLGVLVVLLTTLLCVWIAGRIFRVGLLMQGKAASLGEIARWVWKG
jgi:ABC-2 type transport system permease protein